MTKKSVASSTFDKWWENFLKEDPRYRYEIDEYEFAFQEVAKTAWEAALDNTEVCINGHGYCPEGGCKDHCANGD
jgi:hypothetical protein